MPRPSIRRRRHNPDLPSPLQPHTPSYAQHPAYFYRADVVPEKMKQLLDRLRRADGDHVPTVQAITMWRAIDGVGRVSARLAVRRLLTDGD